ncbi:cytochrome c family protein [Bradyrhizobium sp. WSM1743]|uniref:c-type cytochrome n=1 Tax=Bradyrhizobium sp. WSM1743 TaxID=318996 RepID=UPI000484FE59|nr:c-type cytochrome [Bradyrhizobium sp. WSM1743]
MRFTRSSWAALAIGVASLLAAAVAAGLVRSERRQNESIARAMTGGDPARAPALIRRYGCAGCHTIPGIPGGDGQVGASLADLRTRVYIAGVAANAPDNLVQWIVTPQAFSPRTAMPATGITEAEARDVAAYLYAQ